MNQTNTQFVWRVALEMRKGLPFGKKKPQSNDCWLCGGEAGDDALTIKEAISSGFTDSNIAKAPHSDAVCQPCACLMSRDAWELACAEHGHSPHFPAVEGKTQKLANWMFSSHFFSEKHGWQRPTRKEARELLLSPPYDGKWVLTLAAVGKKHVIFRAPVNEGRDWFFVQLDDQTLFVRRSVFEVVLGVFERGYALGFSKDSMLTGQYNQAACMKAGIEAWKAIEATLAVMRNSSKNEMRLAHFCAQKEEVNEGEFRCCVNPR